MKPFAVIDADAVGADPATPADVLDKNIIDVPRTCGGVGGNFRGDALMLYTSGTTAVTLRASGSVTVEAWAVDEGTLLTAAERRFRLLGVATVVTVGAVMPVVDSGGRTVYPSGKIYLRVTAGNAAGNKVHAVIA